MTSQDWLKVSQDDLYRILEGYDLSNIHIAALGTHSCLDIADGVKRNNKWYNENTSLWEKFLWKTHVKRPNNFTTLAICEEGKETPYTTYYNTHKRGKETLGCVDKTMVFKKFTDALKPENQKAMQKLNTLFDPSRSTVAYLDYGGMGEHRLPYLFDRAGIQIEERSGPFKMEKNQDWLVVEAGLPHSEKFKSIEDAQDKYDEADKKEILMKVSKGVGKRHFERRFQRIPIGENSQKIYEAKCEDYIKNTVNEYKREYEKEMKKPLPVDYILRLEQQLNLNFRTASMELYIPGEDVNLNYFKSPLTGRLEFMGADKRYQFPDGEEFLHIDVSLRESLLNKVFNMGEKFFKTYEKELGIKTGGPVALQCRGDENENFDVVDISKRMLGSPDTEKSPYTQPFYGRPVSVGERIAMEVRYAIDEGGIEGLMKIVA